jgi:hypothetical protein
MRGGFISTRRQAVRWQPTLNSIHGRLAMMRPGLPHIARVAASRMRTSPGLVWHNEER